MTVSPRDRPALKNDTAPIGRRGAKPVVVKPVLNAMRILRYLTQAEQPMRAMDVARKLSLNPSTCYNILRTLVFDGVVDFNELSKSYAPGIGLTQLVERFLTGGERLHAAKARMHKLATQLNVTVTLWRRTGERIVLVGVETSPANLRIVMSEGQRVPLLMGASGRLFAQQLNLGSPSLRKRFKQIRWARSLSFQTYCEQVETGRRRGWTLDDGYFANGILTIAAPVRDVSGDVVFAVSGVAFRGQLDDIGIERLGQAMKALGEELAQIVT